MRAGVDATDGRVVGFLDMGTNSVRLLVVRVASNHSVTTLTEQKETIRLGEGEFTQNRLQPQAMQRAALVCSKFAELARAHGAEEIHAVATAAAREAENQREFVRLVREESGLELRIVSGREEARLIYLGVASGLNLGERRALFIDVGGGSTELILGGQTRYEHLESLRLGAVRLAGLFFGPEDTGPVDAEQYAGLQSHVRGHAVHLLRRLEGERVDLAVGSSGTILNLAEVTARRFLKRPLERDDAVSHAHLRQTIEMLCALPLAERRKVPGINPERADIIVAGAAILDTLMQALGLAEIRTSERGLRDGLLMDFLARTGNAPLSDGSTVRDRSVLRLGRKLGFDEAHARQVTALALALFDSAREMRLHFLGSWERDLLGHAAMLHDIGASLSYENHQEHSYYFIRNTDLLGFDQTEIVAVAAIAFFHRKALPRKRRPEFADLDDELQKTVRTLSLFLRLAESLDRGHAGAVSRAGLRAASHASVVLEVECARDCQLELWGVRHHEEAFEHTFRRKLIIEEIDPSEAAWAGEAAARPAELVGATEGSGDGPYML